MHQANSRRPAERDLEEVGARGAGRVADRDVRVAVETVADPANGAHDVFVAAEFRAWIQQGQSMRIPVY